jgi:hypothetical protein
VAGLGELIGALAADLTRARVQADLTAAHVADLYRSVPLLEGAPIPRFRLPDVVIDLPVVIEKVDGPRSRPSKAEPAPIEPRRIAELSEEALAPAGIHVRRAVHERLGDLVTELVKDQRLTAADLTRSLRISGDVVDRLVRYLDEQEWEASASGNEPPDEETRTERLSAYHRDLTRKLQTELIGAALDRTTVVVGAASSKVRELQDPELVTRIRLTLREDSFELVQVDWGDEKPRERLVPE